jgi:hypothetical protein
MSEHVHDWKSEGIFDLGKYEKQSCQKPFCDAVQWFSGPVGLLPNVPPGFPVDAPAWATS